MEQDAELKTKENFYRLCQLLVDGATNVLREAFDDRIPPKALPQLLANKNIRKSLSDLKREKILTKPQWDVIYPGKGRYGESQEFDISVIILLLRNICKEPPPGNGWEAMPDPQDLSFSADLVRLRFYRNELYAHRNSCTIDDEEFERCWENITKPLLRLGGADWEERIEEYLNGSMSHDEHHLLEELSTWHDLDMQLRKHMSQIREEIVKHSQEVTHVFDAISETERRVTQVSAAIDQIKIRTTGRTILWNSITPPSKAYLFLALLGGLILIIISLTIHSEHSDDFSCFKGHNFEKAANHYYTLTCYDQIITNYLPLFLTQFMCFILMTFAWHLAFNKVLSEIFTLPSEPDIETVYNVFTTNPRGISFSSLHCTYIFSIVLKIWISVTFIGTQFYMHGSSVQPWNQCVVHELALSCHVKDATQRNYILNSNMLLNFLLLFIVTFELCNLLGINLNPKSHSKLCQMKWCNDYQFCVKWLNGKKLDRFVRSELIKYGYDVENFNDISSRKRENNANVAPGHMVESNVLRGSYKLRCFGTTGDGLGQFRNPRGISWCPQSHEVFIADSTNQRIQVFDQHGVYKRQMGGLGPNPGQLASPRDLTIDKKGRLIVADTENHRIQILQKDGKFIQIIDEKGSEGHFNRPCGVTVNHNNEIIVADTYNHQVALFEEIGAFIKQFGGYGKHVGRFDHPYTTEVDSSNNIYVPDFYNDRVQIFTARGEFIRVFSPNAYFTKPSVVCFIDQESILVTQWNNDPIRLFNKEGRQLGRLGSRGDGYEQFNSPCGVVRGNNKIYITDTGNHRVYILYKT